MKGSYLWNMGGKISEIRLIVEGAVTLYEEDASGINKMMINACVVLLFLRFCHDFSAPSKLSFQTLSKKPALHVFATISGKPSVRSPAGRRNRRASARRDEERRFPAALMARDEARHGKALAGLLERYFGK